MFVKLKKTCAPWLPCSQTPTAFTCDERTGTCLCSSSSTNYYTQYYTGSVTDYYGNEIRLGKWKMVLMETIFD